MDGVSKELSLQLSHTHCCGQISLLIEVDSLISELLVVSFVLKDAESLLVAFTELSNVVEFDSADVEFSVRSILFNTALVCASVK